MDSFSTQTCARRPRFDAADLLSLHTPLKANSNFQIKDKRNRTRRGGAFNRWKTFSFDVFFCAAFISRHKREFRHKFRWECFTNVHKDTQTRQRPLINCLLSLLNACEKQKKKSNSRSVTWPLCQFNLHSLFYAPPFKINLAHMHVSMYSAWCTLHKRHINFTASWPRVHVWERART